MKKSGLKSGMVLISSNLNSGTLFIFNRCNLSLTDYCLFMADWKVVFLSVTDSFYLTTGWSSIKQLFFSCFSSIVTQAIGLFKYIRINFWAILIKFSIQGTSNMSGKVPLQLTPSLLQLLSSVTPRIWSNLTATLLCFEMIRVEIIAMFRHSLV